MSDSETNDGLLADQHTRFGWWLIVAGLSAGLLLEAMHGFKLAAYLDTSNETRRLLWTLAHAHATLAGLLHLAFASSLPRLVLARLDPRSAHRVSRALIAGSVLLPAGFALGGWTAIEGDPGLAIVVSPIGGLLLLIAAVRIALAAGHRED